MGPSAIAGWVAMALQRTSPGDPRNCQGEGANNSLALLNWLVVLTIFKNMKVNGKDDIPYMMENLNKKYV